MNDPLQVEIEVTIDAPIEEVWAAIRDPELIKRWHGWDFDGLDAEVEAIYLRAEEDAANWTIRAGGHDVMSLHQTDDGVLVRITRPERGQDPGWDDYYQDITEGWTSFLTQLKFAIERHGLAPRRTLFLSGVLAAPAVEVLGLRQLQPGKPYEAQTGPGDTLTGTVFAQYPNQWVLTVNGWGDGLLIVGELEPAPHHRRGQATITATFYDMDDVTYVDLETRWTAWWNGVTPAEKDS